VFTERRINLLCHHDAHWWSDLA